MTYLPYWVVSISVETEMEDTAPEFEYALAA
jgi:hypothetical protein